jgi:hypothetical protein
MKLSVSLQLLDLGQSVGLLGRVISSSQSLYLYTNKNAHTTQTLNMHALSVIRNHGPGVRASEDSSFLRPLGYRDRQFYLYLTINKPGQGSSLEMVKEYAVYMYMRLRYLITTTGLI